MSPDRPPDLTVVIPTRNRLPMLIEAVASVRAQRDVDWELIVVDDASNDGTSDWLRAVPEPRLRTTRVDTRGERSRARNEGLRLARAAMILFLDDDDQVEPGALAVLVRALTDRPQAVAAIGARRDWFVSSGRRWRDVHPRFRRTQMVFDSLLAGWSATPGQVLCRTSIVRDVGAFDPNLSVCEDRDLWLRLARLGRVVMCPNVVVTYRSYDSQRLPPDIRLRRAMVSRRAIRRLPPPDRRRALEIRRAAALIDLATDDIRSGRFLSAVACGSRAVALAPRVLLTPLIGLRIARVFGYAVWHYATRSRRAER